MDAGGLAASGRASRAWPLDRADVALALGLALACWVLYSATFQRVPYGDGWLLAKSFYCLRDDAEHWAGVQAPGFIFTPGYWYHPLLLMLAHAMGQLLDWVSPLRILHLLSSASGALGIAFGYGLCRAWNAPRVAAVLAAALLALSPAYWFFSTTVEVHALHAACVGLCACIAVCAPWSRPVLASALVAAFLPLLFLSHQSGVLLGPGFVLLAQYARGQDAGPRFRWPALLFGVGPLFGVSFLVAIVIAAGSRGTTIVEFLSWSDQTVGKFHQDPGLKEAYEGWLLPLGVLLPLVAVAVVLRRLRGLALVTTLVLALPSVFFFLSWSMPERGGYTLGTAGFLCAAAATALPVRPRRAILVALPLLALQGVLGYTSLRSHDSNPVSRERLERRAESVARVLPEGGTLLSLNVYFQFIEPYVPDVIELSFYGTLAQTHRSGGTPQQFLGEIAPTVEAQLARPGHVVALDLSARALFEQRAPQFVPYLDALEAWLSSRCRLTRFEDPQWPMALLQ